MFLEFEDTGKRFGEATENEFEVFKGVNISIENNQFVSILGPSGCGKSTLLSMVAGLEDTSEGTIKLEGQEITGPDPERGMVFQQPSLFPWLTVRENVMFPLKKKRSKKEAEARAEHFLKMVHLSSSSSRYTYELSGGMQQRVAIARALAMDPKVLLMDEPFGALDEQTRHILHRELLSIWEETRKTILFVTHSIQEAIKLSDRVIVMGTRPGRIIADFSIDVPRPRARDDENVIGWEKHVMELLEKEIDKVLKEELDNESVSYN
ncbi:MULTISPECIES: ABC transporter ATP-binding protein [Salimicrobium]|uniref:Nitrate/sulfonate/bicarbonate ABC transporter ATP-binding protein n=3 Tax=Salimicrobium TaxID=351195 RepID=K2GBX9_9BACI|nr:MULTISPECIES: ABC transporter ATP-binding protein [Salimicrobium]AKG05095.1 nitrate/sulfonate/bicarbonate ABC transporter ATP-binding protein [Salimicrobium jeotgali]EKE32543.1 sulfonate/nitrate/taurine ABC transporter ATP-binding protein [Salimicrobium jeotgali]MBM7695474.1 NitT/TauT family transport system ATP-binding protein [Salimicrobium jeotgali]SDY16031.1 NitT/TauT family transport system ATP-binding protein [Salimicrobium album]SIS78283.1 NitT/TauT family transport system ATP-bindin